MGVWCQGVSLLGRVMHQAELAQQHHQVQVKDPPLHQV